MKIKKGNGISTLLRLCRREKSTGEYIRKLYPREDMEKKLCDIWKKRLITIVLLLAVFAVSVLYCLFGSEPESSELSEGKYITRLEEDRALELAIVGTTAERRWKNTISLTVKGRLFSKEEMKRLSKQTEQYLERTLPGDNASLKTVHLPLRLVSGIPNTGISISWTVDESYFSDTGKLKRRAVPLEGVDTELMASARWKNWKKNFYFAAHVIPGELSEGELAREAKDAVRLELKRQADKEVVELPEMVGDSKLQYELLGDGKDFSMVYFSLLLLFLVPAFWFRNQKKGLEQRRNQLMLDHPTLVNRIMLLLGAGLTVRKAVERLADEYEIERKKGGEKRYVYEEICVMAQEMRDGVSEGRAVERFGKRCGLLPYLRFASVITQNLKKGAEGILDILEKESIDALEKRKARVLQQGEIAGTRLLFPMIIMLGLVMGIIMVPAFMVM